MRGVPRWLAVLAVVAIVAVVCAFTLHRSLMPAVLILQLSEASLPADGFSPAELNIHSSNGRDLRGLKVDVENVGASPFSRSGRVGVESVAVGHDSATVALRAGVNPGETKLKVTAPGFAPQEIALSTTLDTSDSVGDGTPDFLRLHDPADRAALRRWFTLLAESQYYRGRALPPEIDDCAALLRFAYRESLRQHDSAWARTMALPAPGTTGDVRQYQYPYTPLAAALFRVRGGSFEAADLSNGTFAQFVDVETLWRHNTFFAGRDVAHARPGDLIFFRQGGQKMPFHAMIFLGHSQVESGPEQFIMYHTGPTGKVPGEIRRLTVAQLLDHPDARWHPVASNPSFLGVYRWNILRGAE